MRVALENLLEDLGYASQWSTEDEYNLIKQNVNEENPKAQAESESSSLPPILTGDDREYESFFNVCNSVLSSRVASALHSPAPMSATASRTLKSMCRDMHQDFLLRRTLLLKRLDVTIKAFSWAPSLKGKEKDFVDRIKVMRDRLDTPVVPVNPDDVKEFTLEEIEAFTALDSAPALPGASGGNVVKGVLIGSVPDRGGRPEDKRADQMPGWQERKEGKGGGGGGYKGNKGKGGGGKGGGGNEKNKKDKANKNKQKQQKQQQQQQQQQQKDGEGGNKKKVRIGRTKEAHR